MADLPRHRVYRLVSHTPSRAPARVGTPHLHSWLFYLRHYDVFRLWPTSPHLRHPAGYAPTVCRARRHQHACRLFRRHHLDQQRLAASGCSVGLGQDIGEQMTTWLLLKSWTRKCLISKAVSDFSFSRHCSSSDEVGSLLSNRHAKPLKINATNHPVNPAPAKVPLPVLLLTMRCSEPGHRVTVAIHASCGPGR